MSNKKDNKIQVDYEVIELGEDGSFDIPTPTNKTKIVTTSYEYEVPEIPNAIPVIDVNIDNSIQKYSAESSLAPGEYKIYSDRTILYVMLRLNSDEKVQSLKVTKSLKLNIETTSEKKYLIELPSDINFDKISDQATTWNEFITIKFKII